MIRRTFFGFLAGLIPAGWLTSRSRADTDTIPIRAVATELQMSYVGPVRTPKLRVWTLGSLEKHLLPTTQQIDRLQQLLTEWDGQSDLDIVWGPDLSVQQFDIGPGDKDCVASQGSVGDVKVEDTPDGLRATVVLKEPLVRIVQRNEGE